MQKSGPLSLLSPRPTRKRATRTEVYGMKLVAFAAAIEFALGVVLVASPTLVAQLAFGNALSPSGEALGRVAGFAFIAFGIACGPQAGQIGRRALLALVSYNVLAALFFLWLGIRGELVGPLLWPAAALHTALSVLLARMLLVSKTI